VEVDRLEGADVRGDRQWIASEEQVLEGLEAGHRVARADPDDTLVGLDPDDRRGERPTRLRVPRRRERRLERDRQPVEPDARDAHAASIAQSSETVSLTVSWAASTVPAHRRPVGGRAAGTW
jgi:hypothetical protein